MSSVPSSAIMAIVAVVVAVLAGTFIFVAVNSQNASQQDASKTASNRMNYAAELRYTQYEGENVSGSRVQDILSGYLDDDVSLRVAPLDADDTAHTGTGNYDTNDHAFYYANSIKKLSGGWAFGSAVSMSKSEQNKLIKSQVSKGSRYVGNIIRDNNGGIIALVFEETASMASTTGDSPSDLSPGGGDHDGTDGDGGTYQVRLMTNGGAISSSGWIGPTVSEGNTYYTQEYVSGVTQNMYLPTPTKSNYTFLGWSEDGTIRKGNLNLRSMRGNVDLVAEWERSMYSITYKNVVDDGNAVTVAAPAGNPQKYAAGDVVSLIAPTLAGKTFDGWTITYTDDSGAHTTTKDRGAAITGYACDLTVTAYFTTAYTITYDLGDTGSGVKANHNNPETYTAQDTITLTEPTWADHKFLGWTGSNGTTPQKSVVISGRTGNLAFKANWTNAFSKITLDANGGVFVKGANGSDTSKLTVSVASGENYNFSNIGVKKDGYTLTGWKQVTGSEAGTIYTPANGLQNVSSDMSLEAVWEETKYTIIAHSNLPIGDATKEFKDVKYTDNVAGDLSQWIDSLNYKGGTLNGWNTKADGTGIFYEVSNVKGASKNGTAVELYAQYKNETIYISYRSNAEGKGVTGTMSQQSVEYGKRFSLAENGYAIKGFSFVGWNTKADGTGVSYVNGQTFVPGSGYLTETSLTLYAQWSANAVLVTLDPNGGVLNTTSAVLTIDYKFGGTYRDTNLKTFAPTKEGYSFTGWYTEMEGGSRVTDNTPIPTDDIMLYAHWNANTYRVIFDGNGSTSGATSPMDVMYDQNIVLNANKFTRNGYTFAGWNTKADGTGTAYKDQATVKNLVSEGTITLYAQWSANTYEIRFRPNGGTGNMDIITVAFDQTVDLTNKFTRNGYTFLGWAIHPDETVRDNLFGTSAVNVKTLVDAAGLTGFDGGTITLYATWGMNYTWSYKKESGHHYLTVISADSLPSTVSWYDNTTYTLGAYNKKDLTDNLKQLKDGVQRKSGGTIGGKYDDTVTYDDIDGYNTIVALVNQDNEVAGAVDIGINLTALKKAEEETKYISSPPQYKNKVTLYQKDDITYVFVKGQDNSYSLYLVKFVWSGQSKTSNGTCVAAISDDGGVTYGQTKDCTITADEYFTVTDGTSTSGYQRWIATCNYSLNGLEVECSNMLTKVVDISK